MRIRPRRWRTAAGEERIAFQADKGINPFTGKRDRQQFETRKEARDWLRTPFEGAPPPDGETVSMAAAAFIQRCKTDGLEQGTIVPYQRHIDLYIKPWAVPDAGRTLGDTPVKAVTMQLAEVFKAHLLRIRSKALASKILYTFKSVLTQAAKEAWIEMNPALAVRIRRSAREKKRVEIPSRDELRAIIKATNLGHDRAYLGHILIQTIIFAGLRNSEWRALRWTSVHLDARPAFIRVERRVDQWKSEGDVKSEAGYRDVEIPKNLVVHLRAWQKVCPKSANGLVFPNGDGGYQDPGNIHTRVWKPLQVQLGITRAFKYRRKPVNDNTPAMTGRYSLHALRHAFASLQIDAGVDPKHLQEQMGHASIQITLDTYGHLWKDRDRSEKRLAAIERWAENAA